MMANETQQPASSSKHLSSSGLRQSIGKDVKPLQVFFTKFNNDWSMNFASVVAYNLLMALLPITVALIAILGFILGGPNSQSIIDQVEKVLPVGQQNNVIQLASKQLANSAGILALVAVLLAIFGGSRLFIAIEGCLDILYRVRPRPFLRQNLMALGMFILFIILVPIMVFASAAPTIILGFLTANPALKSIPFFNVVANNVIITFLIAFLGGLSASFILFEAIYFVVPNQRISWHNSWRGALGAAVALTLFINVIFPLYSFFFLRNYAGQIGFAVILLLFFYYFAVILMLGAEINAFFSEGIQPLPNDLVTFVSATAKNTTPVSVGKVAAVQHRRQGRDDADLQR